MKKKADGAAVERLANGRQNMRSLQTRTQTIPTPRHGLASCQPSLHLFSMPSLFLSTLSSNPRSSFWWITLPLSIGRANPLLALTPARRPTQQILRRERRCQHSRPRPRHHPLKHGPLTPARHSPPLTKPNACVRVPIPRAVPSKWVPRWPGSLS